tara:strand:- start:144 stop:392 length:249 start_codon:yes stop_codon:yes gene_type:complete
VVAVVAVEQELLEAMLQHIQEVPLELVEQEQILVLYIQEQVYLIVEFMQEVEVVLHIVEIQELTVQELEGLVVEVQAVKEHK